MAESESTTAQWFGRRYLRKYHALGSSPVRLDSDVRLSGIEAWFSDSVGFCLFISLLKKHHFYSTAVQGQQGHTAWGDFVLNSCESVCESMSVRAPSRQKVFSARAFTPCCVAAEVSDVGDCSFILFSFPVDSVKV